jgi:hypothetical protein
MAVPAVASARQPASPGTFDKAVYLPVPDYADSVAIGDVTGNGRNDLVVDGNFGRAGYLWMYPQQRNGKLGKPQKLRVDGVWNDSPIYITDLYGNGVNEVLLTGPDGVLVFTPRHGRLTGPTTIRFKDGVADFAVARVNGDRYPELVVVNGSKYVWIYDGSKSHQFRLARTLTY